MLATAGAVVGVVTGTVVVGVVVVAWGDDSCGGWNGRARLDFTSSPGRTACTCASALGATGVAATATAAGAGALSGCAARATNAPADANASTVTTLNTPVSCRRARRGR